jgi:hypothetical protein
MDGACSARGIYQKYLKRDDKLEELGVDRENSITLDLKRNRVRRRELDLSGSG